MSRRGKPVEFRVDTPGAFRLRVFSDDSSFFEKTLMTAGTTTLEVPDGSYHATVEPLGAQVESEPMPISIGPTTTRIDLGPLPTFVARYARKGGGTTLPFRPAMLRRSELPERGTARDVPAEAPLRSAAKSRRFTVGFSEDTRVRERGGWRVPDAAEITPEVTDEAGVLTIAFDSDAIGPDHRLRATFALEDRSAIRIPIPLYQGGVTLTFEPTLALGGLDGVVSITPREPSIAALTAVMDQMTEAEIDKVFEWNGIDSDTVVELFAEKRRDPWTATAAAVLLTHLRRLGGLSSWAHRLADIAPYIADTPIVSAWGSASDSSRSSREGQEAEILEHLVEARRRGAPTYHVSQSLALELLSALASTANAPETRRGAKREQRKWSRRGRMRVDAGSYLVWEQPGDDLRAGLLPGDRYGILARGRLTDDGFKL